MTIAAIAYRDLSSNLKANVTEALKHHPEYEKWAQSYQTNSPFDLPAYVFMRASTWPDEIKRHGNQYDHPQWHYVNLPLIPPNFPNQPSPSPNNDIVFAIGECEKMLKDKNTDPDARAVYLSWLIHLVGDIHQPLHCVSLVNSNYAAPSGDKGGNAFFVKPYEKGVSLHSIWDKGLGSSSNPRTEYNQAIELSAKLGRKSLGGSMKRNGAKEWSEESRKIALETCYLNGKLEGSLKAADAPTLPEGYTKNLKVVAEKQAVVAGYRLADEIKRDIR